MQFHTGGAMNQQADRFQATGHEILRAGFLVPKHITENSPHISGDAILYYLGLAPPNTAVSFDGRTVCFWTPAHKDRPTMTAGPDDPTWDWEWKNN
jgi:hypothetical protein